MPSKHLQKAYKEKIQQMNKEKGVLYAVYGTLRRGFGNYTWCLKNEHCTFLGEQRTAPKFKMVSLGGFPGVIPGGNQEVTIEVFSVNSKDVERSLDNLEGYPSFYQKMKVETEWGLANMYILSEDRYGKAPLVESGDWKQHIQIVKR